MKNGSDIQPEDSFLTLPVFSELDKSAQGSSVILCVAVEGDLSFSDKGLVLVNVRFYPRPGIYGNGWHCVCSLPSYTTECKGLHNMTIHCVHAINFYPEDVSRTLDKWWFTQSFATVQRCHCGVQQFTVQFIEFTYFKELQDLTQFTLYINEMVSLYPLNTLFHYQRLPRSDNTESGVKTNTRHLPFISLEIKKALSGFTSIYNTRKHTDLFYDEKQNSPTLSFKLHLVC